MSNSTVNKNPNVQEVGCLSDGYFAKIYADYIQFFNTRGEKIFSVGKKSIMEAITPNFLARTVVDSLNAQRKRQHYEPERNYKKLYEEEVKRNREEQAAFSAKRKELEGMVTELSDKYNTEKQDNARLARVVSRQERVIENLSAALGNISSFIENMDNTED